MSREEVYEELFTMLTDMTVVNGFSRDYTPVKSVYNDSATMQQTPYISLHFGLETELTEGRGMNQYRSSLPVEIVARIKSNHTYKNEIEYEYDRERSLCVDDIKKRFASAHLEVSSCISLEPIGEEEYNGGQVDTNKFCLFVKYVFQLTYKQAREVFIPAN